MPQPFQESAGIPGVRQDTSERQLASKLADSERRLRAMVARYDLNPGTIQQSNLEAVQKIIMHIYRILREDAETQNGALAKRGGKRVWDPLRTQYHQAFNETEMFMHILSKFNDDLKRANEHRLTTAQLNNAARAMVKCREQWLARVTEFQQTFSRFYSELTRPVKKRG